MAYFLVRWSDRNLVDFVDMQYMFSKHF